MARLDRKTNRIVISETELLANILELAELTGWYAHHDRPALMADGSYRTAIQGNEGFPDLVLAKDGRVLFWELKDDKGKPTPAQEIWLEMLNGEIMRPRDWDRIERILTEW